MIAQHTHILRVGTSESEDILVVIAYGNHTHILISFHQSVDECILSLSHILSLIYHQHGFSYLVGFHFVVVNHSGSAFHHIFCVVEVACFAQQVETVGVKSLYFHKMCGIAY